MIGGSHLLHSTIQKETKSARRNVWSNDWWLLTLGNCTINPYAIALEYPSLQHAALENFLKTIQRLTHLWLLSQQLRAKAHMRALTTMGSGWGSSSSWTDEEYTSRVLQKSTESFRTLWVRLGRMSISLSTFTVLQSMWTNIGSRKWLLEDRHLEPRLMSEFSMCL